MKETDCSGSCATIDRRSLLTRAAPACAAACIGLGRFPGLAALVGEPTAQDQHKFDVPSDYTMTPRQRSQMIAGGPIEMIGVFKDELGDAELIRILKLFSAERGREAGARQAANAADMDFQTFVEIYRPPNLESSMTHEVVEDSEKVFALEVRECVWAELFHSAGVGGEIGHAAVCNMDYYWPTAFNPAFKMERTKTLMQGHDVCNHRYIDTA